jgi:putative ABC transport system ATP-binding protein
VIELIDVCKTYDTGTQVQVLKGINLHVTENEFTAILGPSGSGKSTMLHIMGLIHEPTSGEVLVNSTPTSRMDDDERSRFRGRSIGFVFQSFHLVSHLTVAENVELPLFYQEVSPAERRDRAKACLDQVGLSHRLTHRPNQLSGGECQRVAIARALVTDAPLIMADEPTGNLDVKTGEQIFALLEGVRERGKTVVLITHDEKMGNRMDRRLRLVDGKIVGDDLL